MYPIKKEVKIEGSGSKKVGKLSDANPKRRMNQTIHKM